MSKAKIELRKALVQSEDRFREGLSASGMKSQLSLLIRAVSNFLLEDDSSQAIHRAGVQLQAAEDRVKVLEAAQQQIIDSMAFNLATTRKDASREAYNHASLRLEHDMILARMAEAMSQGDPVQALDLDRGQVRKLLDWLRHGRKITPCA